MQSVTCKKYVPENMVAKDTVYKLFQTGSTESSHEVVDLFVLVNCIFRLMSKELGVDPDPLQQKQAA